MFNEFLLYLILSTDLQKFRPFFSTQFLGNTCSRHFLFRACEGFFCVGCFHRCTICSRNDIYLTNLYYIEYLVLIYDSYLDNIFQHNFPEILLLDVFCKEHEEIFRDRRFNRRAVCRRNEIIIPIFISLNQYLFIVVKIIVFPQLNIIFMILHVIKTA